MENDILKDFPLHYEVYSFDIFDTLITRRVVTPHCIFDILQNSNKVKDLRILDFKKKRIDAEFQLRRSKDFKIEVSIIEIYRCLVESCNLDYAHLQELVDLECKVEKLFIVGIPTGRNLVNELRARGKKICYLSDIYHSKEFIRELLIHNNIFEDGDHLFVSSDFGQMKSTGGLYKNVVELLNVDRKNIYHMGDNLHSDVFCSTEFGIDSKHFELSCENKYDIKPQSIEESFVFGASRLNYISSYDQIDNEINAINRVTSYVAAPTLFMFVHWTIDNAIKNKSKYIYYFSRDGQILYEIAQKIIGNFFKGKVQAKYLYVSRQALLFPGIASWDGKVEAWVFAPTTGLTVEHVLNRINFNRLNWSDDFIRDVDLIKKNNLDESIEILRACFKKYKKEIEFQSNIEKKIVHDYLLQEGFYESPNVSIVDIGWGGTLQTAIANISNFFNSSQKVFGYYFGITRNPGNILNNSFSGWFTNLKVQSKIEKEIYIIPMLELFTAANHGGVESYEQDQKTNFIKPVLRSEVNINCTYWYLDLQHKNILAYSDKLIEVAKIYNLISYDDFNPHIFESRLRIFMLDPDYYEALAYGAFLDAEDQNESIYRNMSEKYTINEMLAYKKSDFMHTHNEWRQGAYKISDPFLRELSNYLE